MSVFEGNIDAEKVHSISNSVTVLVDECRVFFQEDKIKVRGTDPAGVALVLVELTEDAFEDTTTGQGDVCWDFSEMADMVATVGTNENVSLKVKKHNLDISLLDLDFTLSLIDPDSLDRDRSKPDLDLPAEIVLNSSTLQRGVNAADLVADHVEFGIDKQNSAFYMKAKGDTNRVILEKQKRDLKTLTTEPVSSTYPISYLSDICRPIPNDTDVNIHLGDDYPAEISFEIVDGDATVTYFVSPRIQPET